MLRNDQRRIPVGRRALLRPSHRRRLHDCLLTPQLFGWLCRAGRRVPTAQHSLIRLVDVRRRHSNAASSGVGSIAHRRHSFSSVSFHRSTVIRQTAKESHGLDIGPPTHPPTLHCRHSPQSQCVGQRQRNGSRWRFGRMSHASCCCCCCCYGNLYSPCGRKTATVTAAMNNYYYLQSSDSR